MNRIRVLIALVLAGALVGTLSGCWLASLLITPADDGTIETISIGDRMRIRLPGSTSTGYAWLRVIPESLEGSALEIIREAEYEPIDSSSLGAPGHFTFEYRAVQSGTITLGFVYRRSWEEEAIDTFSIVVWVK